MQAVFIAAAGMFIANFFRNRPVGIGDHNCPIPRNESRIIVAGIACEDDAAMIGFREIAPPLQRLRVQLLP